jgi:hypothetical protein
VVGLIHDQEIQSGLDRLLHAPGGGGEEVHRGDHGLPVEERIHGLIALFLGTEQILVDHGEHVVEAAVEFHHPLVDQLRGRDHQHAPDLAGHVQAMEDEPGFDGLPQAHFVGQ